MSNTIRLTIQGMNCGHCVKRVTNALKEVAGVTDVNVDLADNSATVTGTPDIEALKAAVDEAGYEVVSFTTA
ncbi:MAG TPA: cation transporter [Clostridiaceae bacterium]|nr:cation transporter [Clostridiaceae bacterium]